MPAAREMYGRAAWTIGFALVVYYINRQEYPGPAFQLAAVITLIGLGFVAAGYGLTWLAGPGQQKVLDQILDSLQLSGSERVLDAGSPRGTVALAAAARLKSGKVIALGDTNSNEAAREVARNSGLGDRVRFESGDLQRLSYPDGHFDAVVASRALDDLGNSEHQAQAVREMVRVLKPGGRIVIQELGSPAGLQRLVQTTTNTDVSVAGTSLPLRLGGHVLTAQKSL